MKENEKLPQVQKTEATSTTPVEINWDHFNPSSEEKDKIEMIAGRLTKLNSNHVAPNAAENVEKIAGKPIKMYSEHFKSKSEKRTGKQKH